MLKQLHQTPLKMSLYELIQTSESHRHALMEVLQSIEVLPNDPTLVASIITPHHVASLTKLPPSSPPHHVHQVASLSFSEIEITPYQNVDPDPTSALVFEHVVDTVGIYVENNHG